MISLGQKRSLALTAHEVVQALLDASKISSSQAKSTAAALAAVNAVATYIALLCPVTLNLGVEQPLIVENAPLGKSFCSQVFYWPNTTAVPGYQ